MKFNILYGKHNNLTNYPLEEGNLYVTDKGCLYVDVQKDTELQRISVADKANWQAKPSEVGYIENRTHWREQDKKPIFAATTEQSLSFEWHIDYDDITDFDYPDDYIELTVDGDYLITYNDKEYVCKAWRAQSNYGIGFIVLGDGRLLHVLPGEEWGDVFDNIDIHQEDTPFVIVQEIWSESTSTWADLNVWFDIFKQSPEDVIQVDELLNDIRYFPLEEPYFHEKILRTKDIPNYNWDAEPNQKGYIKNRTHYREPGVSYGVKDLVLDQGYHTSYWLRGEWNYSYAPHEVFNVNQTYFVIINGVKYDNLTAWSYTDYYGDYLALGDSRQINIPIKDEEGNIDWDSGTPNQTHPEDVPFLILYCIDDDGGGGIIWTHRYEMFSNEIELYPTISIGKYIGGMTYHKIDNQYLPLWDWQAKPGEPGHIEGRTHWAEAETVMKLAPTTEVSIGDPFNNQEALTDPIITTEKTYIITVDGKKYTSTAYYDFIDGGTCLGDSRLNTSIYSNIHHPENVPFYIFQFIALETSITTEYALEITYPDEETHTISIEELTGDLTYHKLNMNYMPEETLTKKEIDDFIGPNMTVRNQ